MPQSVYVYDSTARDELSRDRGVGRYLQILRENFPDWKFTNNLAIEQLSNRTIFINPFFNFLQPPIALNRIANKQVAVIHDLIPLKYPEHFPAGLRGKLNIFLNKIALKNYDLIITDSQASKKDIVKMLHIAEKKIKAIYPCLPKIFTNPKFEIQNQKQPQDSQSSILSSPFCLYVGDATWNKNLVNLARAIKIINVTCVFIGKVFQQYNNVTIEQLNHPWQEELKQFFAETENDKRFIFLGFVEDYRLIKFYQQAKLNVLPSRDEGFGFSYVEASAKKCPSVLSDIPVLKEISKDCAVFVNPNNVNDIADAVGELYFKKDVRETFAEKAYVRSKFFSANKFKADFLEALKF